MPSWKLSFKRSSELKLKIALGKLCALESEPY